MQLNRVFAQFSWAFFCMNDKLENIKKLNVSKPLLLDCKQTIKDFPLAYETYGKLNESKDNAILVFHALTGDQFVSGINPVTKKEGWWVTAVGPRVDYWSATPCIFHRTSGVRSSNGCQC